mmetsp:Transcript_46033/g.112136  ORF Transcript_46033/g.112136 Transcript_46033/m.112136 type:complete len:223 (+) Transcript_46033:88-756(+)
MRRFPKLLVPFLRALTSKRHDAAFSPPVGQTVGPTVGSPIGPSVGPTVGPTVGPSSFLSVPVAALVMNWEKDAGSAEASSVSFFPRSVYHTLTACSSSKMSTWPSSLKSAAVMTQSTSSSVGTTPSSSEQRNARSSSLRRPPVADSSNLRTTSSMCGLWSTYRNHLCSSLGICRTEMEPGLADGSRLASPSSSSSRPGPMVEPILQPFMTQRTSWSVGSFPC